MGKYWNESDFKREVLERFGPDLPPVIEEGLRLFAHAAADHAIEGLASSLTDPCVGCPQHTDPDEPCQATWGEKGFCPKWREYRGTISGYAKKKQDACSDYDYVADALIYTPVWYVSHAGERVECPECGSDLGRWPS